MRFYKYCGFLLLILLFIPVNQVSAEVHQNQFASIMIGKKKIGQVHFMTKHDDDGILQELTTRSSFSFLGIELYHHTMHVHEIWKDGEMQRLWGSVNDHGEQYEISLQRNSDNYSGTLNSNLVTLPHNAFPAAVWHYAITQHPLLFSIPELELVNIKVVKSADKVKIGKKLVSAEKFVFTGDWEFTLWFDHQKQFLKWAYKVKGKKVDVTLDP
jgi:hypothetical protein